MSGAGLTQIDEVYGGAIEGRWTQEQQQKSAKMTMFMCLFLSILSPWDGEIIVSHKEERLAQGRKTVGWVCRTGGRLGAQWDCLVRPLRSVSPDDQESETTIGKAKSVAKPQSLSLSPNPPLFCWDFEDWGEFTDPELNPQGYGWLLLGRQYSQTRDRQGRRPAAGPRTGKGA